MRLDIKPLSVNEARKGRRFKSDKYKSYERDVLTLLRPMTIPEGPLELFLEWGFSSAGSDFDNPIKPFTDCLQKKYGFNDNRIVEAHIKKVKVKKGFEYINFKIKEMDNV
jgi:Holliday junction resolvase RusA-like endonuclease